MTNFLLYAITVVIWGSTWLGIRYQLGIVPPEWSIAYRMSLAAVILIVFCLATRRRLKFAALAHVRFALSGLTLFSVNYLLMYRAEADLASGLVAITFCTITLLNMLNGALIFKTRLEPMVLVGAIIGLIGISGVFWPELGRFSGAGKTLSGLALAFAGTILASFGNMISVSLQRENLPVLQSNAWGLAYGTVFITLMALFEGHPPAFDLSASYLLSLFYLALFGTVVAFYSYLTLLGRIGPGKAAYSSVLFPLIALTLSTVFEGYRWTVPAIGGVVLVLAGNVIVLRSRPQSGRKATA